MHQYVTNSICFILRYDLTGKDIVSMVTSLLLAQPPFQSHHRKKWNTCNLCWFMEKQMCDTLLGTDFYGLELFSIHSRIECYGIQISLLILIVI